MDKLDIYKNENEIVNDAFDQTVMNLHLQRKQNGYKSFVITGCEPGDGATSVAINLASALAASGWKTVLVDVDMRKKNRYKRLNERITYGLSDYLLGKINLDDMIFTTTRDNLSYIPCGEAIDNPVRLLCSNKMNEVRVELSKLYDFIIYDMPSLDSSTDAKVIAVNADAVILVSSMGKTTKKGLVEAANTLHEVNANLIGTIINKTDMDQYASLRKGYDYFLNEKYVVRSKRKAKR